MGPGFGTWIWDLDLGLDLGLTICPKIFNIQIFLDNRKVKLRSQECSVEEK